MIHDKSSIILLISFLLWPVFSFSQAGVIKGKVIDAETGTTLVGATVLIESEFTDAATDKNGIYGFTSLNAGSYYVEVMFLGYQKQTRLAVLDTQDTLTLDFGLAPLTAKLTEVVVTASEQDFLNEPMPATRMEVTQIERMASTNTAELMEEVGGVSVARAGNWGSKPYFQGMTDSRVLMFIDGIKTTQSCPMGMDACTATIEPDMINSVDILVGPGSAQFGSGNMGGIISISTIGPRYRYLDKFKADLDIAGRYKSVSNSRTGVLTFKGGNKKFDFAAGAGGGWHGNYKIPSPDSYTFFPQSEIPHSGFNSRWLHLNARYRPGTGHQISFISQLYRGDSIGWPSRMPDTYTIIPKEKRDLLAVKYEMEHDGSFFKKLEASIGYQPMFHNMVNYPPGSTRFNGNSQTDNYQASVKTYFSVREKHALTVGIEGFIWKMNADRQTIFENTSSPFVSILNQGIMYESGLFVLDRFVYNDQFTIDAGLRINYVLSDALPAEAGILSGDLKDEQLVWTGNIAPLYRINKHLSLYASLVKGFNAATPVDRFINAPMLDGFYHYGNPDLRPEINISKKVGIRGMHNKWSWSAEYFHNSITNLIERGIDASVASPIPGLRGVRRSQNITKGVITGLSAYMSYYATSSLQIALNASYLYGIDRGKNPLPNIAPFEFNPKITYENLEKDFWLTLRADIAAEQNRFAPGYAEIYTPGYVVFDFSGGWKVSKLMELSVGMNNLANRYYRKHLNMAQLPEPGRNVSASIKITLPVIGKETGKPKLKDARLVTLKIEGMACQFCAKTVRERSEALPEVIQSIVYLQDGKAEIIVGREVSLDELTESIERAGFKVQILSVVPYEHDQ
ncbi:MAG: TonB-dependent receptor [Lewinellaceae bacterium]|nr:TonB-dependent receptor [Lewinellaceae bacterium]